MTTTTDARQPYTASWRDRFAHRLALAALRLATPEYRAFCTGAWRYGLDAAARDAHMGTPPPPPWQDEAWFEPTTTTSLSYADDWRPGAQGDG